MNDMRELRKFGQEALTLQAREGESTIGRTKSWINHLDWNGLHNEVYSRHFISPNRSSSLQYDRRLQSIMRPYTEQTRPRLHSQIRRVRLRFCVAPTATISTSVPTRPKHEELFRCLKKSINCTIAQTPAGLQNWRN